VRFDCVFNIRIFDRNVVLPSAGNSYNNIGINLFHFNSLYLFILQTVFPTYSVYYFFALCSLCGSVYGFFFVPETTGKNLEEIGILYRNSPQKDVRSRVSLKEDCPAYDMLGSDEHDFHNEIEDLVVQDNQSQVSVKSSDGDIIVEICNNQTKSFDS